ncbi:PREDICTED: U6 snRNA phosphodiesterase-like isoform X10 [Acropora digitifera]|uniref:U6 snRNA phosphodiesterase-like isoform X10 n=1 Tax=Acropora digitifera TaxID=70779 RepID=UPI00077AAE29|nr:PREDICTED: U6 snRNA phosphodiesterase-like isoform X10 [Acropora digitifera]
MFEESRLHHKDTECVEDQCIFNGPIRTFPHFPGNWAMHVFIPFMATVQFENLVTSLVASLSPVISSDVHKLSPTGLHVSVSRTVAIRHYWIDTLVQQLRYMLQRVRRSFIALKTSGECQKDPSFHVSVAWFLGECCANEILVNLQISNQGIYLKARQRYLRPSSTNSDKVNHAFLYFILVETALEQSAKAGRESANSFRLLDLRSCVCFRTPA